MHCAKAGGPYPIDSLSASSCVFCWLPWFLCINLQLFSHFWVTFRSPGMRVGCVVIPAASLTSSTITRLLPAGSFCRVIEAVCAFCMRLGPPVGRTVFCENLSCSVRCVTPPWCLDMAVVAGRALSNTALTCSGRGCSGAAGDLSKRSQ